MTPSRAVLYGTALLTAMAAHGAVVALLWFAPPALPAPPAVRVRLIERPLPVGSTAETQAPPAPVAKESEPEPSEPEPELSSKPPPVAESRPNVLAEPEPQTKPAPKPEPKPKLRLEPRPNPQGSPLPGPEPAVRSGRLAESAGTPQAVPRPMPAQSLPEPELALYCPHRPPPRYPATARRLGQEGVVELEVELSAAGRVTEVRVVRSSGWPMLDRAAVAAVRGWRCDARRIDGAVVAASARQRIRFSLR